MNQNEKTFEEWTGLSQKEIRPDDYWKSELNERQWEAVHNCDDPMLVIAGAGSGKTRVLTYKIAYLLEHGYLPWQILALTFTNKAAKEMNERIAKIVKNCNTSGLWSGTFHSIFARILRAECSTIGFHHDFTIYDTADQRSLLKSIIKELQLDDKVYKPNIVANYISDAKNRLLLPLEYAANETLIARDKMNNLSELHRIYSVYWQRCRTAEAMDFDDLLLYTYILFYNFEEVRRKYADRFQYILVDEYQDTNYAQYMIISLLTKDNRHICVVGDDAQSIYSFRGANIDNILQFNRQYEGVTTIKLEQNYRSTQRIVDAANSIIAHNQRQIQKSVYSENAKGDPLLIMAAGSDKEEVSKVSGRIKRLQSDGVGYDDIAVLYRTNAQSRSFEDVFRQRGIPYRIYGGLSFYQRKEIKDILAYFRLLTNLDDEEAFKRIVNYPARGIGDTTLQKIISASRQHDVSLWAVAEQPHKYDVLLNRGLLAKLESFCSLILEFRTKSENLSAYQLAVDIITNSGIQADLAHEDGPEGKSKQENVEELLGSIKSYEQEHFEETGHEFAPLRDYLSQVALLTDADKKEDGTPRVTLMTVHAAKGLEFEAVFVTGLEQDLFPASSASMFPKEMEEERRLFYVAVTRAKRHCFLTYAQTRYRYGNMDFCEPSQFIREIDQRYVREDNVTSNTNGQGVSAALREALFGQRADMSQSYTQTNMPKRSFGSSNKQQALSDETHFKVSATSITPTRTLKRASSYASTPTTRAATETKARQLKKGTIINHDRFGRGEILNVEGSGDNAKAQVAFENSGIKNLLLKFAKFTIIS